MDEGKIFFFPVDWRVQDVDGVCEIIAFGRDDQGRSVCIRHPFQPFFYVCCTGWSSLKQKAFYDEMKTEFHAVTLTSGFAEKKTLWGFTAHQAQKFLKLSFQSLKAYGNARYALKRRKVGTFEAFLDGSLPLLRLFHQGVKPSAWLVAGGARQVSKMSMISRCGVEYKAKVLTEVSDEGEKARLGAPKLVLASWDIEVNSSVPGKFPSAEIEGDTLFMVGITVETWGVPGSRRTHVIAIKPQNREEEEGAERDEENEPTWHWVEDEAELVRLFAKFLLEADVAFGWNVAGFDWKYLDTRISNILLDDEGEELIDRAAFGKLKEGGGLFVEKKLSSAAFGDNVLSRIDCPGVFDIDLMVYVRKELKFDSYKLDSVAEKLLGLRKIDLPTSELFRLYELNTPSSLETIGRYCARDTELPLDILSKLNALNQLFEMANVTMVPPSFLVERGQGIKTLSLIVQTANAKGYVCPDIERKEHGDGGDVVGFKGATVLDPQVGFHDAPVAVLDFASLYPSIIRAELICFTTVVMNPEKYGAVEGYTYKNVTIPAMGTYTFAEGGVSKEDTVIPSLLTSLLQARKEARKKGALALERGDAWQAALYDAQQLAYKVSANSVYGGLGATFSALSYPPLAAAVTTIGRGMLELAGKTVVQWYPSASVVYGAFQSFSFAVVSSP